MAIAVDPLANFKLYEPGELSAAINPTTGQWSVWQREYRLRSWGDFSSEAAANAAIDAFFGLPLVELAEEPPANLLQAVRAKELEH